MTLQLVNDITGSCSKDVRSSWNKSLNYHSCKTVHVSNDIFYCYAM